MIGIYKITNKLNGKSYIGQSIHCGKRFDEHCSGRKQFIDETIQLEGKNNFVFELLEECEKSQLSEREDYYIAKYNTMLPNGYNKKWNTKTQKFHFNGNLKETNLKDFNTIENSSMESMRYFKTIPYEKQKKGPLTEKQYLVYAYLLSISKWNATESHYYVYKNSFLVKEACNLIEVSQPTWRKALEKLNEERYIKISEDKKNYKIYFDASWAKLNIELIKFLVSLSHNLSEDCGGILPALYGVICRYWILQKNINKECLVTLSSLNNLFFADRTKKHLKGIYLMLHLFKGLGLMDFTEIPKVNKAGQDYLTYKINFVQSKLPKEYQNIEKNIENECNNDIVDDILQQIIKEKSNFEEYYNKNINEI